MDTIVTAGEAADALRINQIHQSITKDAYWVSGGDVTPGTASTQIEVNVASGEANINSTSVTWASDSVVLSAANNDPRVDVVYVQEDGTLTSVTGTPHSYRPNTDENGDPFTPAPFEHWEPSPDDGSNVIGLPLACVLVKPTTADSTDLTSAMIQDRRLSATTNPEFLRADGVDNGSVTVTSNDADLKFQDTTDPTSEYLWRDFSAGKLYLGAPNATPTFRTDANLGTNDLFRDGQSMVTSGDGVEMRELYVQGSAPSTSNPYLRFQLQ